MGNEIAIIVVPPTSAAIGFAVKYGVDVYKARRDKMDRKKAAILRTKLEEFYYPILFKLLRETDINRELIDICKDNRNSEEIIQSIEGEILNNHVEIQRIIHEGMVKVNPPKDIRDDLIKYDKHVTFYQIIRNQMGETTKYPREYNAPYPTELLGKIEARVKELADEYDRLDQV